MIKTVRIRFYKMLKRFLTREENSRKTKEDEKFSPNAESQ